jgi:membrane fusion protein, multidrug efflux system
MRPSKRIIAAAAVIAVLSLSGAGAYLRINGQRAADSGAAAGGAADLPNVSAAEQFATDLAVMVEGAAVRLDTLVLSVTAAGEATSTRQTTLRAQVAGQVRAVRVRESSGVAAGTVLIEIDPVEYQLALDEARARLRETEARYREITLGDDRIEDGRIRAERDSAARARSGLDVARVAVQRAEINLARTRVTAPFAGIVANLKVVAGQQVTQGEELVLIQSMDPIRVEAKVLEGEIGFLQPGRQATITFAAFPGEVFEGVIETINPVVEQQTRTARVAISVRNPGGRILPGMYARVSLSARRFPDRIVVPREAIRERDRRTMLFVFEGENDVGRAKWRYVNTGLMNDRYVEIVAEGPEDGMVEPGEIVLVAGHHTLQHDIRVRLAESARGDGARVR